MLGGQPSPSRFLARIIAHAEVLPVYLEEEGWHVFLHQNFCRLCLTDYSAPLFMARRGVSSGIPFFHYDITPLPANAPPPPGESTYHGDSRQAVVLRMHYKSGRITASFISLPAFEGKTSAGYLTDSC